MKSYIKTTNKNTHFIMKYLTNLILFLTCTYITFAQGKIIPLYSGDIPNSKSAPASYRETYDTAREYFTRVSVPTLTVFSPKKGTAKRTAVIIFPSGGYRVLVDEGEDIAKAFTSKGITAFALKYRLPNDTIMLDKTIGPLQDAQMAIKHIRMNAKKYNIDTNKIGFVGLSAGGHLASTEATHLNTVVIENKENTNLRPDFMVLLYPVISFTHAKVNATIAKLLGTVPSEDSLTFFSNEKHVSATTPPTFLLHAGDDERVSVQHSLLFYEALQEAKVKTEFHILQNGGHGFGLEHETRADNWMLWCMAWLRENGFGIKPKNKK